MINYSKKYIFVHIPKTAGNSIKPIIKMHGHQHKPLSFSTRKLNGGKGFFKFCFVRNPWDRLISAYFYIRKGGWTKNNASWDLVDRKNLKMLQFGGFKDFILNCDKRVLLNCRHFASQSSYVDRPMDFIGRTETLQSDVDFICARLGIPSGKVPHKNTTQHKPYTEYYNDETRAIVADIYSKDISSFGYTFEGFSPERITPNED